LAEPHALKGNTNGRPSQKISVFDNDNNETTTYDSMYEAARVLNIRWEAIKNYFKQNQVKPYKGRYIFTKV
jgi:hypothetical protein